MPVQTTDAELPSITDPKPCTAENPAAKGRETGRGNLWHFGWSHPDAVGVCINLDYDDWRYDCPHCGCYHIYEGPDA